MTETEARLLLAFPAEGELDRKSLRRAYLKRVKAVSPERDPEGFKRVRQAYEILVTRATGAVTEAELVGPDATPEGEASAGVPSEAGSIQPGPIAPAPDPFEPWRERLAAAPPDEQVGLAREALATMPASREARWTLLSCLADGAEEFRLVLREGAEKDPECFADELLLRWPGEVSRTFLAEWLPGAAPARALLIADAHAHADRADDALAALQQAVLALDHDAMAPSLPWAWRPLFTLSARDHFAEAREALKLVERLQGEQRDDVLRNDPESTIVFMAAQELIQVGESLPKELRTVISSAVRDDDLERPQADANAFVETLSLVDGWRLRRTLARTPMLSSLLCLGKRPFGWRHLVRGANPTGLIFMVATYAAVVALTFPKHSALPPQSSAAERREELRKDLLGECSRAFWVDPHLCDELRDVMTELERTSPDCHEIAARMRAAESMATSRTVSRLEILTRRLSTLTSEVCPQP